MLSESASKELLGRYGIPFAAERNVASVEQAIAAAKEIGYPVVIKLCGDTIAHKTERGLVRLGVADAIAAELAATDLLKQARADDGVVTLLVAPMISGSRELIAGMITDPQFGKTVMLGVGGIYTEAMADVVFRTLPLQTGDVESMLAELRLSKVFKSFRNMAAIDTNSLRAVFTGIELATTADHRIESIDINPLIVDNNGCVVGVDCLVEISDSAAGGRRASDAHTPRPAVIDDEHFWALFEPAGVVVAGASSHPGKFGFVSLHNILAGGYEGPIFGTNRQSEEILGIQTVPSVGELPIGAVDLAFVCTPASANVQILRDCAAKGIRVAFISSAGYRDADSAGRLAEDELIGEANKLGIMLIGPNGQGVVSTPARLCAQIVAPNPPRGSIAVASQSGNFVSSFLNYSRQTQVGISRAVSAGNAAQVTVGDLIDFYSRDGETKVSLAYIEGIEDGSALLRQMSLAAGTKPLVVVKGGATVSGARAAASHTGSLASNDAVFEGVCRQYGITRAASVEQAFDVAATFATQPLPRGNRTVVVTTVGGWGVVTTDAIGRDGHLRMISLPKDLEEQLDELLPPRWSKNNPIDCAGGETRDTIPEILEIVARHDMVDAIIYLGIGIQSNQARLMREGRFYPDHGLERIVNYHERQDERFAQAAHLTSQKYDKPILTATELSVADPQNAGARAVKSSGRLCYASGDRAAIALGHIYRYARFRGLAK